MFPYFGRKARLAHLYPSPLYDVVIEPFAGSMAYTLTYRPRRALGVDADERLVALWHRMASSPQDIEPPTVGTKTDDLLVKLCSYSEHASTSGPMTVSSRMLRDWPTIIERARSAGPYVRTSVDYRYGDYTDAPDIEATWFIDPPYQVANRRGYRFGADGMNFDALAAWVHKRRGQVIVCEQAGADWLPFKPLTSLASHRGSRSTEVVYFAGRQPILDLADG